MKDTSIRASVNRMLIAWGVLTTTTLIALFLATYLLQTSMQKRAARLIAEQEVIEALVADLDMEVVALLSYASMLDTAALATYRAKADAINVVIGKLRGEEVSIEERLLVETIRAEHASLETHAQPVLDAAELGEREVTQQRIRLAVPAARALREHISALLDYRKLSVTVHGHDQRRWLTYAYGTVLIAVLAALAVTVLFMQRFDRMFGQRLGRLGNAVQRLGDGELDVEAEAGIDDEIGAVARALNQTTNKLRAARAEIESKNTQLMAAEKMAALGRMMAGIAHELNNPLASVVGYAELLRESRDLPAAEAESHLGTIVSEAGRARDLIRALLTSARAGECDLDDVGVEDVVSFALRLRQNELHKHGIQCKTLIPSTLAVRGERQRLQQIAINIINNAIDAMRVTGGELSIAAMREGECVLLSFEDSGPGFSEPDRALEPFYTTKPVGDGTGLGLSLAHEYAQQMKGGLRVGNRRRGGARIELQLQASDAIVQPEVRDVVAVVEAPVRQGSSLPILIVDDEQPLRTLTARLLSRLSIPYVMADSGEAAIAVLMSQRVQAIISDVRMPGPVDGIALFEWLEANAPELTGRFAFLTGDTFDPAIEAIHARSDCGLLMKPFNSSEFKALVEGLMAPAHKTTNAGL